MPFRYRKKPIVIEAFQYHTDPETTVLVPQWVVNAMVDGTIFSDTTGTYIKTLEGDLHLSPGDWIIRGVKGELYPCKPDIFEKTYEKVSPDE